MKHLVLGVVAHVDAGKTTLSESLLFDGGTIRQIGRVDHRDTYLDTAEIERARGITVFSKQARFSYGDLSVTLLDTPGHVDFSAEMERSLQVLDYAILVISGLDGVQSHTRTLWKLLREYEVPCFLFINKMDIARQSCQELLEALREGLHGSFVDMEQLTLSAGVVSGDGETLEELAMANETMLEAYTEAGSLNQTQLVDAIVNREIFPCIFGSALKNEGVERLLEVLDCFTKEPEYADDFGARVFKIGRDKNGNRLTHVRLIGGSLKNRQELELPYGKEKVTEIRQYNGERFESLQEVGAGEVCTLLGLTETVPGQGIGVCDDGDVPLMEAVLTYQVIPPTDYPLPTLLANMRQLEEEDPALQVEWLEETKEIHVNLMGPVQTEVLQQEIKRRFGVVVTFGAGKILYKETITQSVEGVGHYEPLRHYADVHLLIEPLELGSGIQLASDCSQDVLALNWQRLILTHLGEKLHRGILTGAPITDVKVTVIGGRAHIKHTVGGDFRQATYRALRQGLKKAAVMGYGQLLEPFYKIRLVIPQEMIGRAMTDLERMQGTMDPPEVEDGMGILCGRVPVSMIADYGKEVAVYTGGMGQLSLNFAGYYPCHNTEEVIAEKAYDSDRDLRNSCDSVFPAHGVASIVPWHEVEKFSPPVWNAPKEQEAVVLHAPSEKAPSKGYNNLDDELEAIFVRTFGPIRRRLPSQTVVRSADEKAKATEAREAYFATHKGAAARRKATKPGYVLVDGYNVIHAWKELAELMAVDIHGARGRLLEHMSNFQGVDGRKLIVVFDAYLVKGNPGKSEQYQNIYVVYTKEAQTADAYIERATHELVGDASVTVVTSDRAEQTIVAGSGALRISSEEFEGLVERVTRQALEDYRSENNTLRGSTFRLQDGE
ncbi:MAG: TetM/TetW/TetO/TetS family tetracycline resistance ribosomal protection protein [Lachnospiraceae bacterium]|nr:TetM/TetW/TetO/TetS family tetracycline resistance ribosomal protection protein [Lachnospiraceae bacterium]